MFNVDLLSSFWQLCDTQGQAYSTFIFIKVWLIRKSYT